MIYPPRRRADAVSVRPDKNLRRLIEQLPEVAWAPIPYWLQGAADVARIPYGPFRGRAELRLIVRRVRPTPSLQLALQANYSYYAFITDREGAMLDLEADHRRHAEVENAIRDLKGLNHVPSGRFAANSAWLAV